MEQQCESCRAFGGAGWVLSNNSDGLKDIQRCDNCLVFHDDALAREFVLEYVKKLLDYLTNTGEHR
jgi:hypothetical protein